MKCCRSIETQTLLQIIETGEEKMEEDFNIYRIIDDSRRMKFELAQLKKKLNLENDPIFQEDDDNAMIDIDDVGLTPPTNDISNS